VVTWLDLAIVDLVVVVVAVGGHVAGLGRGRGGCRWSRGWTWW
jgi:hypothetical protein